MAAAGDTEELPVTGTGALCATAITVASWPEAKNLANALVKAGMKLRFALSETSSRGPEVLLQANGCRVIVSCTKSGDSDESASASSTSGRISYTDADSWGKSELGISLAMMTLDCRNAAERGQYDGGPALPTRRVFRSSDIASKLVIARKKALIPDGGVKKKATAAAARKKAATGSVVVCADALEPSCGLHVRFFQCTVDDTAPLAAQLAALPQLPSTDLAIDDRGGSSSSRSASRKDASTTSASGSTDESSIDSVPAEIVAQQRQAQAIARECLGDEWKTHIVASDPASGSIGSLGEFFGVLVRSANADATAKALARLLSWQRAASTRGILNPPFHWSLARPDSIMMAVSNGWPRAVPVSRTPEEDIASGKQVSGLRQRGRAGGKQGADDPRPGPGETRPEADPVLLFLPPTGTLAALTRQLEAAGFTTVGDKTAKGGSAGVRTFQMRLDDSTSVFIGLIFIRSPGLFGSPDDSLFERTMRWGALLGLLIAALFGFIMWGRNVAPNVMADEV